MKKNDSYLLLDLGWGAEGRVHYVIFHMRIHNDKIWVEDDLTEYGVVGELLDAGIANNEIFLDFQPADNRPYTEFAVN